MSSDTPPVSEPAFWRDRYARGEDGWELGRPSPTLAAHLARTPPPRGRVAVLGCGRGHDARLLAALGYRVWGFDFAPEPIAAAKAQAVAERLAVDFVQRDIFGLAQDYTAFFDGIWEYTCFCAIDPARRPEYAELVSRLLVPGGWLLACFFPLHDEAPMTGPPFPVTEPEIRRLFVGPFTLEETYAPLASPPGREGKEWMVVARRSGDPARRDGNPLG